MKKTLLVLFTCVATAGFAQNNYQEKAQTHSDGDFESQSGYRMSADISYAFGVGKYGMDRIKGQCTNDWYFNPYFGLGFGVGVHNYLDAEAAVVPLFADFRANFLDGKISPYLSVGVGYSFNGTQNFKGIGFYLNPTIGVNIRMSPNINSIIDGHRMSNTSSISVGFGYEMQRMDFYSYPYDGRVDVFPEISGISRAISIKHRVYVFSRNLGAISIKLGVSF